jgi:hypothetical protein
MTTEIICVIDKSGSMSSIWDDTIGGFNAFLKQQQQLADEARLTLNLFDTQHVAVYSCMPINWIQPLTRANYIPNGGTALYDAMGLAIDGVGRRLHHTPEHFRPSKVIFVTLSDGEENSSAIYTADQIGSMIALQSGKYAWEFLYLGANQNAILNARKINIPMHNAANYAANRDGIRKAFLGASATVASYRTGNVGVSLSNAVDTAKWDDDVTTKTSTG